MLAISMCEKRGCKNLRGFIQPDGTEATEQNVCLAFPKGIPAEIAYGDSQHTTPLPSQDNDIVFERVANA